MKTLMLSLVTVFITVNVCPSSATAEYFGGADENVYFLGTENLVQIKIFGEAGVNQTYRIDQLGSITHALVGRVKLAGLTVVEAEHLMEKRLADGYIKNPRVTVFIIEHSRFSILGEVRNPGTYEILGRVSIIEALSMAGGFTSVANQRNVKILRKDEMGEETLHVDASNIIDRGNRHEDLHIKANDIIIVPKSFF